MTTKALGHLLNVLSVVIVSLPFLYFNYLASDPNPQTGFYCNDETIALPYKNDTVSFHTALTFGLSAPLLIVIAVEMIVLPILRKKNSIIELESETLKIVIGYLFGAAASVSLVGIAKFTIGRLRPHFLDVCKPDFGQIECGTFARPNYITEYTCLGNEVLFPNKDERGFALNRARDSFYSGHTSMAFQAATFVVLYLHARFVLNLKKPRNVIILVPTIQLAFTSLAFWLALTRVKDHMHHPGDVIAGALIGTGIQIFNVFYNLRLFQEQDTKEEWMEKRPLLSKNYV